jgi:hypothetical protein
MSGPTFPESRSTASLSRNQQLQREGPKGAVDLVKHSGHSARGNPERRTGQEVRVAAHLGPADKCALGFEALELPERSCQC